MSNVSPFRIWVLRAMYGLIVVGLGLSTWPDLLQSVGVTADAYTVINAFLIAIFALAVLGLARPLALLPLLLFELVWKSVWLILYALPMHINGTLDDYASGVAVACIFGMVVTPLAVPWRYVVWQYFGLKGPAFAPDGNPQNQ